MKNYYSQAGQDEEAYKVIGASGYFIDFGCNDPIFHNNTYALEQEGWRGVLVDIDPNLVSACKATRSEDNAYFCEDLRVCDLSEMLTKANAPKNISYISMDADEANQFIIEKFPFDEYNVQFITFEHDLYRLGPYLKDIANRILKEKGFTLYKENVVASGYGEFEDWWIKK